MEATKTVALPPVTDWYPHEINPARPGVYEIEGPPLDSAWFARWDGSIWFCAYQSFAPAEKDYHRSTWVPGRRWRGLSADPAKPRNGGSITVWPADLMRFAEEVKAEFLARTGQYLTNDVTREAVIAEAVAAEREACAQLVAETREWKGKGWTSTICPTTKAAIASAIRARGAA